MTLGASGQLTLIKQLNANGGVVVNQGNGYFSNLIDSQLYSTRDGSFLFRQGTVGGYYAWRVNGDTTNVMTLGANGLLSLTKQLNANGGVVTPSVTNNSIKSTRYRLEVTNQNLNTNSQLFFNLSNFGFSGDWKNISLISCMVFNNDMNLSRELVAVDNLEVYFEAPASGRFVISDIDNSDFANDSEYTNSTIYIIIEENI